MEWFLSGDGRIALAADDYCAGHGRRQYLLANTDEINREIHEMENSDLSDSPANAGAFENMRALASISE